MISIILSAVIILGFTYVGIGIDRYYKERLLLAREYESFLHYASREIEFLKTELDELLTSYRPEKSKRFQEILYGCAEKLRSGAEIVIEDGRYLSVKGSATITGFMKELAKVDYAGRNELFSHADKKCIEYLEEAVREKKQKGELFRKLFILIGIGLAVMLI